MYYDDLVRAFVFTKLPRHPRFDDIQDLVNHGRQNGLKLFKFKEKTYLPRVRKSLGILKGLAPTSILDIGPGRGTAFWAMVDAFPHINVIGLDQNPQRVEDINAVHEGGIDHTWAYEGNISKSCNIFSSTFDIVTALEVLEHIPDVKAAINNIAGFTERAAVISVPSVPDNNPDHIHLFCSGDLEKMFLEAGFHKVQFDYVPNHLIMIAHKS